MGLLGDAVKVVVGGSSAMAGNPVLGGVIAGGSDLIGGYLDREATKEANAANIGYQREFAQKGIRWRVKDAIAAGIHPLAALGAQGASFSPSVVPESMGSSVANMGQNISRAMAATMTQQEKELAALQIASIQKDVIGKDLDNQIRAKQLQNLNVTSPAFPGGENFIPGQGNSPSKVKVKPAERTATATGRHAQEAGWVPDVGYARTDTGLVPVPSKDVKERIEDQLVPEMMWAARNYLMPNFADDAPSPPKQMLPKGYDYWDWSYLKQEWQPAKRPRRKTTNSFQYK